MKNLVIIALALVTLNGFAQKKEKQYINKENRTEIKKEMTAEDVAGIQTKKLTLELDLTNEQQEKVYVLILEQSKLNIATRKAREARTTKPTKDEIVKAKNDRLDQQIKMKREMKAILTAEQYAKFDSKQPKKHKKGKKQ